MKNDYKKITVLMVCYNQEKLIGTTIDSILAQKEYGLYEIVIGDDCSSDGTWEVLMEYHNKYPQVIKPIRNEHNLGIYGNLLNVKKQRGNADLFIDVAGDDPLCEGFFYAVQNLIEKEGIDTSEAIGIYSDWKIVTPAGKEIVHSNAIVKKNYNLWSLYLRGKIFGRSLLVSNKVIENFDDIILDQGLGLSETMYDSQPHLNIKKAYYIPLITSVYNSGIGVSTKLKDNDWKVTQMRIKMMYLMEHYAKSARDKYYIKYHLSKCDFIEKPSLGRFIMMFYWYEVGQLPGCRNSFKHTCMLFGSLFKKYLLFKQY